MIQRNAVKTQLLCQVRISRQFCRDGTTPTATNRCYNSVARLLMSAIRAADIRPSGAGAGRSTAPFAQTRDIMR